MNATNYKTIIQSLINDRQTVNYLKADLKRQYPEILEYLLTTYPQLNGHSLAEYWYWFKHNLIDFPKCPICGKSIAKFPYTIHCNAKCSNNDPKHNARIKQTLLDRYGDANYVNRAKMKETIAKHNAENPERTKEIEAKRKATKVLMGRDKNWNNSEKAKRTNTQLYGVAVVNQFNGPKRMLNKYYNTCKDRYNVDCTNTVLNQFNGPFRNKNCHYTYDNRGFDSSWELAYYIWLKDHNIEFEYPCPITLKYFNGKKMSTYYPDFLVEGEIVEIKGEHLIKHKQNKICPAFTKGLPEADKQLIANRHTAKYQCMIDNKVNIISNNKIQEYLDYVNSAYNKQFLQQFRRQTNS